MTIVIVGDGKVGTALTQLLAEEEHSITVVDTNARVLAKMQEECDAAAVVGHGASRTVLLEAGVDEADLMIAATSSDEINLLSCLMAKKLGCGHTIARVRSPEYAEDIDFIRHELGLSFAINPEEACAREIFNLLQLPSFLGREQFAKGKVEIVKLRVGPDSPLRDTPLFDLYSAAKVRVLVCAADRDGEVTIPGGGFIIREGDELYITAGGASLAALARNLGLQKSKVTQVTLVGGSKLALYLGGLLLRSGVAVKIIEKNPVRCHQLADLLPEADIIEGDGTDQDILLSESIGRCDALVALTDIDEENIVLSMYARQLGVRTIITKCNREQYGDMFRKVGIDTVVSPKLTIAEDIVRYVRAMDNSDGGEMVAMHQIAGGKAEAMEFHADYTSRVLGIPLVDLPLKPGILVACISRGFKTIIPSGDTVILAGDSVVVVTANQRIFDLDDILL